VFHDILHGITDQLDPDSIRVCCQTQQSRSWVVLSRGSSAGYHSLIIHRGGDDSEAEISFAAIATDMMTNAHPKRVVSLIASATEIICALGARDLLVGRSHECDFPPDVRRLPSLTEPKFRTTGTSYDIDARVKAIVQEGLAVYRVDAEKLEALRPDIIVTQDHCEVGAGKPQRRRNGAVRVERAARGNHIA
jgi:ABC-type Fe3+-hydroxamate transport system substrate-binding protein